MSAEGEGDFLPGQPFPPGPVPEEPPGVFKPDMHTHIITGEWDGDPSRPDGPEKAHLSTDSKARKEVPMATGLLDYFPDALADVARLSKLGNDKHNPGEAMHWSRHKSSDHADCIMRHLVDRGTCDTDGLLHDTKVAWRALAQLQVAIERLRAAGKDY